VLCGDVVFFWQNYVWLGRVVFVKTVTNFREILRGTGRMPRFARFFFTTSTDKYLMQNTLLFAALLTAHSVWGQKGHELKISAVEPVFQMAHLSYEYQNSPRWGLELMARYNWDLGAYTYPDPPNGAAQQVLTVVLSQRFYPLGRRKDWLRGFLFGAYLREDWLVSSSWKQFPQLALFDEYTVWEPQDGRVLRAGAGLMFGYKKYWGKHLLAEVNWGYDLNSIINNPIHGLDIAGLIALKAGWKF